MDAVNGLSHAQIQALLKKLDSQHVYRRQSDSQNVVRHDYVRGTLSEIFGPLGWSETQLELTEVPVRAEIPPGEQYVAYRARVRLTIHPHGTPAAHWDGAGAWAQGRKLGRDEKQISISELHSDCMNGALSVALLRASKNLGNAFGLFLYSPSPDRPGYQVQGFLTHPLPPEEPAEELDDIHQQLGMDYTTDPDHEEEHAAP